MRVRRETKIAVRLSKTMEEPHICCICFSAGDNNVETSWTCTTCNTRCHLACITSWAQSNHNRYQATFSCPVCRQVYPLSTIPGVETIPLSVHYTEPGRSGLAAFITSVLRSATATSNSPSSHPQEQTPTPPQSVPQVQTTAREPLVVVNGTGAINVGRVTIVNHF